MFFCLVSPSLRDVFPLVERMQWPPPRVPFGHQLSFRRTLSPITSSWPVSITAKQRAMLGTRPRFKNGTITFSLPSEESIAANCRLNVGRRVHRCSPARFDHLPTPPPRPLASVSYALSVLAPYGQRAPPGCSSMSIIRKPPDSFWNSQ